MKYLMTVFILLFTPVFVCAQSCGTVEPIQNTQYGAAVTNEDGNVIYIVDNAGEVSITMGQQDPEEPQQTEPTEEEVKPQVAYGVVSNSWWTGVAVSNPSNETRSGILKIGAQYYNITVPAAAPMTFLLADWVVGRNTQYVVSLYSDDLYLEVIRGQY